MVKLSNHQAVANSCSPLGVVTFRVIKIYLQKLMRYDCTELNFLYKKSNFMVVLNLILKLEKLLLNRSPLMLAFFLFFFPLICGRYCEDIGKLCKLYIHYRLQWLLEEVVNGLY